MLQAPWEQKVFGWRRAGTPPRLQDDDVEEGAHGTGWAGCCDHLASKDNDVEEGAHQPGLGVVTT